MTIHQVKITIIHKRQTLSPFKKRVRRVLVIPYNTNHKQISKSLRSKPTEAERCLWKRLKLKHLGFVFHRQKPIGEYIVDFYCPKIKLVIEVDGKYHDNAEATGNDKARDKIMQSLGMTVLRFHNSEVLNDTDKVIDTIRQILLVSSFDKE